MTLQDLGNCWSWNRSNVWCNVSWIISCDTNSLVYWTLDRMVLIVYFLHQVWNVLVFLWLQDRNSSPLLCPLAVLCFVPLIKSYLTSGTVNIIMIKYIYTGNNVQMVKRAQYIHKCRAKNYCLIYIHLFV